MHGGKPNDGEKLDDNNKNNNKLKKYKDTLKIKTGSENNDISGEQ